MMFKELLLGAFIIFSCGGTAAAQTREHQWGVAVGGGPQDYSSNLGNGFKLSGESSWHGAVAAQVGNYLNPSFDLVFTGSIGDLSESRLRTVGILMKYKFANELLMPEASQLKPYIYAGASYNHLTDSTKENNLNSVNYLALNAGLGIRYYVSNRIHLGYNFSIGYFLIKKSDFLLNGGRKEPFLHNALMLGIDLF